MKNIPTEWTKELLRTVCHKTEMWIPNKDKRDSFHYIDVSSVSNNTFTIKEASLVKADDAPGRARKIVKWQDTIFATIRPSLKRVAFISQEYDNQIASTAFCVVRPNQKHVTPLYVYFFLLSDLLNIEINGLQHGASYPAITDKDVLNQTIPLPPLSEQQKIAAIIYKIQKAIEIQESIIEKTRELKKSTLHHVFTHGLRGEKFKETEIGPMPESWSVQRFEEFATLHRGYDLPIQDRTSDTVPIVGSNGIVGYHNQSKVKGPGVVTGRSGSIGISYYVADDYWPLNTGLYVEDFHGNDPLYVHYFFQSFDFGQYAAGVSVPTLNRNIVHAALIFVPQIREQKEIANILKTIDQKIELHTAQKSALQDLFKTMLNKLMTGEIRVKDLDIDVSEVESCA
ncbi:MAG: restriction endonuclease subunit S [Proteobacteria bacterium]|nr:restriction endonuclease subunit S [Pseudomonadota bacterium]